MNLKGYRDFTRQTAIYQRDKRVHTGVMYTALGLAGEVGEFTNKIKKYFIRDSSTPTTEQLRVLEAELGDILWYWARAVDELGLDPEVIMQKNVDKLTIRKINDKIKGEGDNR